MLELLSGLYRDWQYRRYLKERLRRIAEESPIRHIDAIARKYAH